MTVRRLDPETGDIVTSGNQFVSEQTEVGQTISTRLKLYYGEYFRDITEGTPWFQSILTKQGTLSSKDGIIKSRIVQTPDVQQLIEYTTDYDINERRYSVNGRVLSTYGVTDFNFSGVASGATN